MHLTKRERQLLQHRMTATQRVSLAHRMGRVVHIPADDIDQRGKGLFKGKCNRTACVARGEGIVWWNRSTRAYYCAHCKDAIDAWVDKDYGPCFEKYPHVADGVPQVDPEN
ncbi:hypothetical protein [Burkholderia cepacia]|uniref:hypothetical protein n=1 Tax=Burkholderia cepacia TaxID=292 RepID=UPI001576553D|nr:hypothetical protein [Burkholderia cepacia]